MHCFHLFYKEKWGLFSRIACVLFRIRNEALHLLGSFGSSSRIVRFSSPISCLGWEVFHWIDCLVFFPHLPFGLGGFSPSQPSQVFIKPTKSGPSLSLPASPCQSLVFLLSSLWVRRFFTNHTLWIFRFSSSVSHWVRRFFIDRSRIFLIVPLGARSMILRNLVFPPHLPIYRQEVFSTIPRIGYTTSIATRSSELAPKKEGNCNAVATKITWLHLSTNISLSPPIALTYHLIPNSSLFQYIKPHSSIIGNWLFYIALLRNASACYPCHPIIFQFIEI